MSSRSFWQNSIIRIGGQHIEIPISLVYPTVPHIIHRDGCFRNNTIPRMKVSICRVNHNAIRITPGQKMFRITVCYAWHELQTKMPFEGRLIVTPIAHVQSIIIHDNYTLSKINHKDSIFTKFPDDPSTAFEQNHTQKKKKTKRTKKYIKQIMGSNMRNLMDHQAE